MTKMLLISSIFLLYLNIKCLKALVMVGPSKLSHLPDLRLLVGSFWLFDNIMNSSIIKLYCFSAPGVSNSKLPLPCF